MLTLIAICSVCMCCIAACIGCALVDIRKAINDFTDALEDIDAEE